MTPPTNSQLRACIASYGSTSLDGELAAEVLRLRAALTVAEDALAVKASLRDNEQRRVQLALETVRAALRGEG